MGKMPWLKLYTEIRTDPKMQALTDSEFRLWINLLCLAAESKIRGAICIDEGIPYPTEALARVMYVDHDTLIHSLDKFTKLVMISQDEFGIIYLSNFDKRQYDKPSNTPEATRERKRKQRENAANAAKLSDENNVTPLSHPCHAIDIEEDIEIDKDKDNKVINISPPLSIKGGSGGNQTTGGGDVLEINEQIDILKLFEQEFGRLLSPLERQNLVDLAKKHDLELITKALSIAVEKRTVKIAYVRGILENWERNNVKNLQEVANFEGKYQKTKSANKKIVSKGGYANGPSRSDPAADIFNTPSRYKPLKKGAL